VGEYEILEHTADVGLRAAAGTLEELFEEATHALLEINGAVGEGAGSRAAIAVTARDLAGLLVAWLSEVLYTHDSGDSVVTAVEVEEVADGRAVGSVTIEPRGSRVLEGTAVKAITYHQLKVERDPDGDWIAEVYVDV
jgi:SHS2 domain-containing protein